MTERLIVLLDMDCFYVQVEERHYPHIKGRPAAVVQYNTWKGGGIIAVNYEARAFGVKRGMRGDEARSKCPDMQLVQVPTNRGKADLTRYRDAGKEVIDVLCDYGDCVERASIDEAYIDFTNAVQELIEKKPGGKAISEKLKSTWVVGHDEIKAEQTTSEEKEEIRQGGLQAWLSSLFDDDDDDEAVPLTSDHPNWNDIRLAYAAVLCEEMRAAVLERTGFKCSAGITHNKMLSKLSCGLHKPNQQTILPFCEVETLWQSMPVSKVRNLGGKLGDSLTDDFGCKTMGDLRLLSLQQLTGRYDDKTAHWLHNLGKGIDNEQVTSRQLPKSIGCGKNFQGKEILNTREKVQKWMLSLSEELSERLDLDQAANKRRAKTLTVSVRLDGDNRYTSMSRSSNLPSYCAERITRVALSLIQQTNQASPKDPLWSPAIKNISLSAGKFEDWANAGSASIQEMFKKVRENPKNNIKRTDPATLKNADPKVGSVIYEPSLGQQESTEESKKCDSELKVEPTTSRKTVSKNTNSFFKNFLQKRESHKTSFIQSECNKTVEDSSVACKQISVHSEKNANYSDESLVDTTNSDVGSEVDNDLDLLVSFLSDDEEKTSNNGFLSDDDKTSNNATVNTKRSEFYESESDDSVYDASTDIDSSISSESVKAVQLSQDLFAEDSVEEKPMMNLSQHEDDEVKEIVSKSADMHTHAMSTTSKDNPGHFSVAQDEHISNEDGLRERDFSCKTKQKIATEEIPEVSVEELFPDLDNFDESLLLILPNDLKLKVEKALKIHKTKAQQRKSGLWKYVTSNPSPQKADCVISKDLVASSLAADGVNDVHPGPSRSKEPGGLSYPSDTVCAKPGIFCTDTKIVKSDSKEVSIKDIVECDKCGLKISAFEMPEHADYHVALSLQSDIRKETNQVNRKGNEKYSVKNTKNSAGRKRNKVHVKTSVRDNKIQKLDSFFKS